ncbi:hypothetical protein F8568_027500 [Actinomadura sp. LD22]|uniref:HAD family hydrolase n=1 Tax=Actinomadura physcomitrii TaxID=2650748 RepID=A0A6I4MK99_9ACTN|nr:hypothetical protein [Actinomadura physcomitrii]MWA04061.1 hypothetical protein [Actinomadura physcomitrii]
MCVLTGGWSRRELEEEGAAAVYDDLRALLAELDGSPLAGAGSRVRDGRA